MRRSFPRLIGAAVAVWTTLASVASATASHEIVMGFLCDRTGATQTVGVNMCPGAQDYVRLVNAKGGVEGHKIRLIEIDHEYKVPPAVEAYERYKKEGAVVIAVYGTPIVYALTQRLTEDRIPGTTPGFGRGDATDGTRYPSICPIAATYWSQGAAAVDFARKQLGGLKGKKIAYIFYDNPAGREPIPVIEDLSAQEGFQLKTFAVPPPGVEMGAQVLDIAQRYHADFVIAHLFGRSPSVSIKEFKRVGYPLRKVVSFVWGSAEADVEAAGGWSAAEGYHVMQFAGVGTDYPVLNEIREMYKKEGKPAPKEMASMLEEDGHAATCGDLHDGGGPRPDTHGCGIRPGEPRHRPRLPVRPDGGDPDGRRRDLSRVPRLRQPRERQWRRDGAQAPGRRSRSRVQGAGGHGVVRALQEGGGGRHRRLRRSEEHTSEL